MIWEGIPTVPSIIPTRRPIPIPRMGESSGGFALPGWVHCQRNWSYELNMREIIDGGGVIGEADKVIEDVCRLRDEYGVTHLKIRPEKVFTMGNPPALQND